MAPELKAYLPAAALQALNPQSTFSLKNGKYECYLWINDKIVELYDIEDLEDPEKGQDAFFLAVDGAEIKFTVVDKRSRKNVRDDNAPATMFAVAVNDTAMVNDVVWSNDPRYDYQAEHKARVVTLAGRLDQEGKLDPLRFDAIRISPDGDDPHEQFGEITVQVYPAAITGKVHKAREDVEQGGVVHLKEPKAGIEHTVGYGPSRYVKPPADVLNTVSTEKTYVAFCFKYRTKPWLQANGHLKDEEKGDKVPYTIQRTADGKELIILDGENSNNNDKKPKINQSSKVAVQSVEAQKQAFEAATKKSELETARAKAATAKMKEKMAQMEETETSKEYAAMKRGSSGEASGQASGGKKMKS